MIPEPMRGLCIKTSKQTGEERMKTNLVPHDIYLKHENEWQALREAANSRIDVRKREAMPLHIMLCSNTKSPSSTRSG
jgi:hypothetical protein